MEGIFNIRDFGAVGDGVTDDLAAVQQALAAAGSTTIWKQRGAVVYFPPVPYPRSYYLADNLDILAPLRLLGVGTASGNGGSRLRFAAGKGIRIWPIAAGPLVGDAGFSVVQGLDIYADTLDLAYWKPNYAYSVGDKIRCPCASGVDSAGTGNGEFIVHYECIIAGISSGATPDFWTTGCQNPDTSVLWAAGINVKQGTVVRSTDPAHYDVFFTCISPTVNDYGTTGNSEPIWDYVVESTTTDNDITWKCVASGPGNIIKDGSAVFACRTSAAIHALTTCSIVENYIEGVAGAAIHLTGNMPSTPSSNVNFSRIERNWVGLPRAGGVGIAIYGGDASASHCYANRVNGSALVTIQRPKWKDSTAYSVGAKVQGLSATGSQRWVNFECTTAGTSGGSEASWNYTLGSTTTDGSVRWKAIPCIPEYGIYDRGFAGNYWFSCFAEECSGPGFALINSAAAGGTLLCYSENYVPDVYQGYNTLGGGNPTSGTKPQGRSFGWDSQGVYNLKTAPIIVSNMPLVKAHFYANSSATILGWDSDDDSGAFYGLQYDSPTTGWWGFVYTGTQSPALSLSTARAAEGGTQVWAREGIFVGTTKAKITTGISAPTSGTWRQGDIVLNTSVNGAGTPSYWQCTASGTPGTWVVHNL